MPVSNRDIWQSARQLVEQHDADAHLEAMKRVRDARQVTDTDTEAVWMRIGKAISELQRKKPGSS